MNNLSPRPRRINDDLAQITVRIRSDQKNQLESEQRARGNKLADVVRENLDLAFAMKKELSSIVEGEYEDNDPANTPRLVHSLLFRVEERILSALDSLAEQFERRFSAMEHDRANGNGTEDHANVSGPESLSHLIDGFVSLISDGSEYSAEVWIGALLEILPRLELMGREQLGELTQKGEAWLEEHGYYETN